MELLVPILVILLLLFISAFFSGAELALMALDPIALETRVREGSFQARLQKTLRSRPQRFLSTILIGYNVANIALTAYVTGLSIHHLEPLGGWWGENATMVTTVAVIIAITIFAELMPKTVAAIQTVRTANLVVVPMYGMDWVLTPLNWVIEKVVMPMIYLMTGGTNKDQQIVKRADIATALTLAHAGGELHQTDLDVAHQAVHLSTRDLEDVMTPRVDVVAVDMDCTVGEALTLMIDSGFTRLPVYGADLDEIRGVLLLKDLVRISLRSATDGHDPEDKWASLPAWTYHREVIHLPESKSVVETMTEMRGDRVIMAVVVDEHGGTSGIVTLEDIIEELVGEIQDESDTASADIIRRADNYVVVTGRARIDQLPELQGVDLSEQESGTIGGLMMETLGRPAVVGDTIDLNGVRISALKVLRNRIKLLRIETQAEDGDAPDSE